MSPFNQIVYGLDYGLRNLVTVVRADGKFWGQISLREHPNPDELAYSLISTLPHGSIVVVEKLRGLRKRIKVSPTYLPFMKFQAALKHFAPRKKIKVAQVDPSFTSQTCPRCQFRSPLNRLRSTFRCVKCGYVANADYVGALNVALRYIKELEAKQREKSKIKARKP